MRNFAAIVSGIEKLRADRNPRLQVFLIGNGVRVGFHDGSLCTVVVLITRKGNSSGLCRVKKYTFLWGQTRVEQNPSLPRLAKGTLY